MFTPPKLIATLTLALAACAATAATASAADTIVAPLSAGVDLRQMTALEGTIVWSTGHRLMRRDPDGSVGPVEWAPTSTYRSIDLGLTGSGRLVLTYLRCDPQRRCAAYSDDLSGRRARFRHLAPARCVLSAAPARWRARVAYGLDCSRLHGPPHVFDPRRSGVFVRTGAGPATRLRTPSGAPGFERYEVSTVDLRGTDVAAVVRSEGATGAVVQTVGSRHRRSTMLSEGAGEEAGDFAGGASLGSGGVLWSLTYGFESNTTHAAIGRLTRDCDQSRSLPGASNPNQSNGFPAEAIASDGARLYLFVRGVGIVTHAFGPAAACP
jgi:hypothetical protein